MFTEDKVTEIFFMADEFHKVFCRMLDKYSLNYNSDANIIKNVQSAKHFTNEYVLPIEHLT